jgi:hypothetical protein
MAEVADHLVPTDGLTNARLRFAGLDLLDSGVQSTRFDLYDENERYVATPSIECRVQQMATPTPSLLTATPNCGLSYASGSTRRTRWRDFIASRQVDEVAGARSMQGIWSEVYTP